MDQNGFIKAWLGEQGKLSATKENPDPVIGKTTEAASSVTQGLDLRIEAFGNGVVDRMKDVIEQSLKVAFEHFSYRFKLGNAAANHSSIPEGKKLQSTVHIGA